VISFLEIDNANFLRDGIQSVKVYGCGIWYEVRANEDLFAYKTKIAVHVVTKEDGQTMYGFETAAERNMFRKLLTAKGIGGGTAMKILADKSPDDVKDAIARKDPAPFMKIKGVGEKAAQAILKIKI
jgi:Holliday junction DNA helicase RuvA